MDSHNQKMNLYQSIKFIENLTQKLTTGLNIKHITIYLSEENIKENIQVIMLGMEFLDLTSKVISVFESGYILDFTNT